MLETWRWFGPDDPVTLEQIKQAGATGIVTALNHIPTGEVWSEREIITRKKVIEATGLSWSVVESVPVHNAIKLRHGNFRKMIANYRETLINLGNHGIDTVCYNFMPVVDWTRTDLRYTLTDKSQALRFDMLDFATYDIHILQRSGAQNDYPAELVAQAAAHIHTLDKTAIEVLEKTWI